MGNLDLKPIQGFREQRVGIWGEDEIMHSVMHLLRIAGVTLLIAGPQGAVGATTWLKEISDGNLNPMTPTAVIATADGGYAVAGYTTAYGAWYDAAVLVKLDGSGAPQWQRVLGATNNEFAYALAQTSDGGYILAGQSNSFHQSYYPCVWVVRLDSDGAAVWQKRYALGYSAAGQSVLQASDGGFAVVGSAQLTYNGPCSGIFLKLNDDGTIQWQKTLSGTAGGQFTSLVQTSDGGYAVAGAIRFTGESYDLWLVRLDSGGAVSWQKRWGGSGDDYGTTVLALPSGGFLLAGNAREASNKPVHVWLIAVDGSGSVQWEKSYGGTSTESLGQVIRDGNNFVAAGWTYSFPYTGDPRFWLFEVDGAGTVQWQRRFSHGSAIQIEKLTGVAISPGGGYVVVGPAGQFHGGCAGAVIMKTDGTGSLGGSLACLSETATTVTPVDPSASTQTPAVLPVAAHASAATTTASCSALAAEVKTCDPQSTLAPVGLPPITAVDLDDCADTGVRISWPSDPSDWGDAGTGDRTYDILRGGALLASCIPYGTTTYMDTQGTNNVTYAYAVRYSNGGDLVGSTDSAYTMDAVSLPAAPSNLQAADADPYRATGVDLSWSAPADWGDMGRDPSQRGYRIYRNGDALGPVLPAATTSYRDTTGPINPMFSNSYQVAAVNACGNATASAYAYASDAASPPGEASGAGHPMTVSKGASTWVNLAYTPGGCATAVAVYWGLWNTSMPGLNWTGSACLADASGSAAFDAGDPPSGQFIYFVVVGNNGATEGSYGKSNSGSERPRAYLARACDFPQNLGIGCPY